MDDAARKRFSTAQARACLAAYQLKRVVETNGRPRYIVMRWNLTREFTRIDAVEKFLDRAIGGAR